MYETDRARVRVLVILFALCTVFCAGCSDSRYTMAPVSIAAPVPYSYQGQIGRAWGGDNFEVFDSGKLHYAFMRGIDTPEPGQPRFDEAKALLQNLSHQKVATISVVERNRWKCEVCDVRIADPNTGASVDPALELLKSGLAWFDNSDGPWAKQYREAERQAREKKIGIWSDPDPVPPWEFWDREVQAVQRLQN